MSPAGAWMTERTLFNGLMGAIQTSSGTSLIWAMVITQFERHTAVNPSTYSNGTAMMAQMRVSGPGSMAIISIGRSITSATTPMSLPLVFPLRRLRYLNSIRTMGVIFASGPIGAVPVNNGASARFPQVAATAAALLARPVTQRAAHQFRQPSG